MEIFFIIILGLVIGSFLNVCIYRIASEKSIVFPASHCTKCGYELRKVDLIPVVSYIFLKESVEIAMKKFQFNIL